MRFSRQTKAASRWVSISPILESCRSRRITRVDSAHAFAWAPDGRSIVLSQFTLVDNARLFADLFRVDVASGAMTRLTRSARLTSPDVHPSGRTIVAVQYDRIEADS